MKQSEKGFTLVEVVFAVAIAVLVSVAAASVILSTQFGMGEAEAKNNAASKTGAVLECFKSADTLADFKKGLEFVFEDDGNTFPIDGGDTDEVIYLYFYENGRIVNNITYYNENTIKKCDYFMYIKLSGMEENTQSGMWEFNRSTELGVIVYNKKTKDKWTEAADPIGSDAVYDNYKENVLYELKGCKKGSVSS